MVHLREIQINPERFPTTDTYPFSLPIFRQKKTLQFPGDITIFIGENGSGKSTLIEAITRACGIHIWEAIQKTRYTYNKYEKQLHRYLDISWADGKVVGSFFGSDIFHNFAQSLDSWASADPGLLNYFGGKSLLEQSHGQSLLSFFKSRYKLRGLYVLDEPETALSPSSQLELLELLNATGRNGTAQFIIATHSPILMACAGARIYNFDRETISTVCYDDIEHVRIYYDFLQENFKKK